MRDSRSALMCVLTLAVVATVTAARPAVATAQDVSSTIESSPPDVAGADSEPMTHGLVALARADGRIAFGVRRGAIQHRVTKSPFDDVYGMAGDPTDAATLVTVHRFGQRAPGAVRILSNREPPALRLGLSEEPLRLSAHPPIVWNLAERIRIAFGGRGRSLPTIDQGLERLTPAGSLTIEFGDRR